MAIIKQSPDDVLEGEVANLAEHFYEIGVSPYKAERIAEAVYGLPEFMEEVSFYAR